MRCNETRQFFVFGMLTAWLSATIITSASALPFVAEEPTVSNPRSTPVEVTQSIISDSGTQAAVEFEVAQDVAQIRNLSTSTYSSLNEVLPEPFIVSNVIVLSGFIFVFAGIFLAVGSLGMAWWRSRTTLP